MIKEALKNIVENHASYTNQKQLLIVYDKDSNLAKILYEEYKKTYEDATFIYFEEKDAQTLKEKLYNVKENDVVILIQTASFRLSDYRIRLDLTNRGIIVIEHNHLGKIQENEYETYFLSLQNQDLYFQKAKEKLMPCVQNAKKIKIICNNTELIYDGAFDEVKANIGDLSQTKGSFYPIGEFFTEPCNLENVNGSFLVWAFPDDNYKTVIVEPFNITIENGCIKEHNGPKEFEHIIQRVQEENSDKKVWIREMGFGLNTYISKTNCLSFISAAERHCGFHVSVGLKHGVYRKKIAKSINQRYHIDLFIDVKKIIVDNKEIFCNGKYLI